MNHEVLMSLLSGATAFRVPRWELKFNIYCRKRGTIIKVWVMKLLARQILTASVTKTLCCQSQIRIIRHLLTRQWSLGSTIRQHQTCSALIRAAGDVKGIHKVSGTCFKCTMVLLGCSHYVRRTLGEWFWCAVEVLETWFGHTLGIFVFADGWLRHGRGLCRRVWILCGIHCKRKDVQEPWRDPKSSFWLLSKMIRWERGMSRAWFWFVWLAGQPLASLDIIWMLAINAAISCIVASSWSPKAPKPKARPTRNWNCMFSQIWW